LLDYEDLVGHGTLGLIQAIDRFDDSKGAKFSNFALTRIRGAVLDAMRAIDPVVSISPKTAEGHNSRIMTKVGAKNRADLVRFAIGAGLVRFDALGGRPGSQSPTTAAPSAEEQSSRSESGAGDDKRRAS
jgi:DNA-directed RNA polymerase specialized sigma24 family protein